MQQDVLLLIRPKENRAMSNSVECRSKDFAHLARPSLCAWSECCLQSLLRSPLAFLVELRHSGSGWRAAGRLKPPLVENRQGLAALEDKKAELNSSL